MVFIGPSPSISKPLTTGENDATLPFITVMTVRQPEGIAW